MNLSRLLKSTLPVSLLAVLIVTMGCATRGPTTLAPVYLEVEPITETHLDPDAKFEKYETFALIPYSVPGEKIDIDPITEKQLLFFLRTRLEALGYRYVTDLREADIVATLIAKNTYRETEVPPSVGVLPLFIPGRTATTFGTVSALTPSGLVSGNYTATTTTSGSMTVVPYTRPGYKVGRFYPWVFVALVDKESQKVLWTGSAIGTSRRADIRISSQFLIDRIILRGVPRRTGNADRVPCEGRLGLSFLPYTIDGNSYYPTIVYVWRHSPAHRKGLRRHDMILAINNVETRNMPGRAVRRLLCGTADSEVHLRIRRGKEIREYRIKRAPVGKIRD